MFCPRKLVNVANGVSVKRMKGIVWCNHFQVTNEWGRRTRDWLLSRQTHTSCRMRAKECFLQGEKKDKKKGKLRLWWLRAVSWLQRGGGTCEDVVEGGDEDDGRQSGAVSATGAELSEDFNEQLWQPWHTHAHTHTLMQIPTDTLIASCPFTGIKGCEVVECSL